MAFEILVGKDVSYAAKVGGGQITNIKEVGQLQCGALAIFSVEDGTLVLPATPVASLARHKEFRVVVNYSNNGDNKHILWSQPFKEEDISPVPIKRAYIAPQKQVTFIGNDGLIGNLNLPGILVAGSYVVININETTTSRPLYRSQWRIEVPVKTGDTNITLITRVINTINNTGQIPVTATVVGASVGIKLESKSFGTTFEIGLDEYVIDQATVIKNGESNSKVMILGTGTPSDIKEYEDYINGIRGYNNRLGYPNMFSLPSIVDGAEVYDQYAILTEHQRELASIRTSTQVKSLIVAIPQGAACQADFETILTLLFPAVILPN